MKKIVSRLTILTLSAFLAAAALFFILYRYDNKYITRASVSQDGVVILPGSQEDSDHISWLVEGWEFFPDQIIEPGETVSGSVSMYIGQYFSFSSFHSDNSPFGEGTYRLTLHGIGDYTLLLPEVFSACKVYINGVLAASAGSLSPYSPYVRDLIVPIEAKGDTEILIQVSNYTHYYSGITYPPAIGSPRAVSLLLSSRMLFYGFLCFTSLALALFSSVVWLGFKKDQKAIAQNRWLGIAAFSFALHICYPFVRLFGLPVTEPLYALEDASASMLLLCTVKTVSLLCLKKNSRTDCLLTGISAGFVIISAVFPLAVLPRLPGFVPVYGQIVFWYKAMVSVFMIFLLLKNCLRTSEKHSAPLIPGLVFFFVSLGAHALTLGHFEPARFVWFEEWGSFILILLFAFRMAAVNISVIRENNYLNTHLQEEVAHKTAALTTLLDERRMLLASFAHDLKTPLTSITTFTRLVELDNTGLDDESRLYLDTIRRKTGEMKQQLDMLHEFTSQDVSAVSLESINLCDLIMEFYEINKPDIDVAGLNFELSLPRGAQLYILGDREKLMSVLQNLVYNAVSFTPVNGTIRISLHRDRSRAVISVADTGSGIAKEDLSNIFNCFFTRRKDNSGEGLGLYIAKSIVMEHGGDIQVSSTPGEGSVFTLWLPVDEQKR